MAVAERTKKCAECGIDYTPGKYIYDSSKFCSTVCRLRGCGWTGSKKNKPTTKEILQEDAHEA